MDLKTVLHVTAHLGGGVGKVLSGISSYASQTNSSYQHKIILLEQPEKQNFLLLCKQHGIDVHVALEPESLLRSFEEADIVQLEWWHHPVLARLLAYFPSAPVRTVVWSHISGCNYPQLPVAFLQKPDAFVFSSAYSYENPLWSEQERELARVQAAMVNSSGGFEYIHPREATVKNHGFCIGYIGTQHFSKLHPAFVRYCQAVGDIPEVKFVLVGDPANQEALAAQFAAAGMGKQTEFVDYVDDVSGQLARFDVFGYILNPSHYGTTENILLEAMAAGLPVVCLRQCAEQFLIEHNKTGLLVSSIEEYAAAIGYLYRHSEERARLGENARQFVLTHFSVQQTVEKLNAVYDKVMEVNKKIQDFSAVFGTDPFAWFLAGLPPAAKCWVNKCLAEGQAVSMEQAKAELGDLFYILYGETKSSLRHYYKVYPDDGRLQKLVALLGRV